MKLTILVLACAVAITGCDPHRKAPPEKATIKAVVLAGTHNEACGGHTTVVFADGTEWRAWDVYGNVGDVVWARRFWSCDAKITGLVTETP